MLNSAGESPLLEIREKNICLAINIVGHRRTTIRIICQKVSRCFLPIRIVSIRIKSHKSHGTRSVFEILCRLKMNISLPAICRIWITTKNSIQHRISREVGRGIALIPSPHRQIQTTCHLRITIKSFRLDGQRCGRNIRLQNDLHIAGMLYVQFTDTATQKSDYRQNHIYVFIKPLHNHSYIGRKVPSI